MPTTRATDDPVPGDPTRRAATLRDAARRAGVHPSTASRALSGSRTVRQPVDQIGDEAVAMLFSRQRDGRRAPRRLTLSPAS